MSVSHINRYAIHGLGKDSEIPPVYFLLVSVCIAQTVERKISGYNCQIASGRAMTDNRHNDTPVRS
jgi:hypothetical protein